MQILRDKDYEKNPLLLDATTSFFSRVINQLKATFIFFQLDYLIVFHNILNENKVTNSLVRGLIENPAITPNQKRIEDQLNKLKGNLHLIIREYVSLLQKNKLLAIESLFRF